MKKLLIAAFALMLFGCHKSSGQVPPSQPPAVQLSWALPAASGTFGGCTTSATCVFAISRTAIASGSCPTPSTSGTPNYGLLTTTTANAVTYTDSAASPGNINCYIAQTQQGVCPTATNATAPCTSTPSNVVQLTVSALPLAPTLNSPVGDLVTPPQPNGKAAAPTLVASMR